jgi:hypothetical protein
VLRVLSINAALAVLSFELEALCGSDGLSIDLLL